MNQVLLVHDFSAQQDGRPAILLGRRNWLMTSGEVEMIKILMKGLPFAIA
jgi:hypothetical protein